MAIAAMLVWYLWYISSHSYDMCSLIAHVEIWKKTSEFVSEECLPGNADRFLWQASSRTFYCNCHGSITGFTAYREYILQTPWCADRLGLYNRNCMLKPSICLGYGWLHGENITQEDSTFHESYIYK
jgi:hypothetical protein